jgi:hypothetical protein
MLNKYSTIVLGAMLGLSTLAFTGTGASAAAMLPLSPIASGEANAANEGIVQVNHKKKWQNKNFNNKCFYKNGGCYNKHRNKNRRDRFDRSYLFLPLVIGGGYGGYNYYDDGYDDYGDYDGGGLNSRHIRYCLNKYQSYNLRNNTWVSFSGQVRQCRSPYM